MKKIYRVISLLLAIILVASSAVVSYADGTDAKLYNIYGNSMLFQQNEKAVLSGTAKSGSTITCELLDKNSNTVAQAGGKSDGEFEISFDAPEGSYDEYTVKMYQDGNLFATLTGVVFGELWLASGQSNMQYNLGGVFEGKDWKSEGKKLDKWIRALYVPAFSTINGEMKTVDSVQKDIEGCAWYTGEDSGFYNISGVAYFFAASLREKIDMPVGILNVPLGGSSIMSWLSRESIENSDEIKTALTDRYYVSHEDWDESGTAQIIQMTSNYNMKIYPLRNFNPNGMIWYQGETDVQIGFTADEYKAFFFAMQDAYSSLFGFEEEKMPIVFTQLAQYYYNFDGNLEQMQVGFAEIQKERPDSIAMTTIYDVDLDYYLESWSIHPGIKRPVGERMAYSANGLVYSDYDTYTAAYVKSYKTEGNSIYVTLSNVGNGLEFKGNTGYGFAIADDRGIFVKANADIISKDTIRIWNDEITEPVSASYAYDFVRTRANLYATDDSGYAMPASSFMVNKPEEFEIWYDDAWADFDTAQLWMMASENEFNGYADMWKANDCSIAVESSSAYSGEGGLSIKGNGTFSVISDRTYDSGDGDCCYNNYRLDYTDYGKMTVSVRNNGDEDITIDCVKIYTNANKSPWFAPEANDSGRPDVVIPADGQWHVISLDLNSLYLRGNNLGIVCTNNRLKKLTGIELVFSGENADISVDNITFSAETDDVLTKVTSYIENVFTRFCGIFTALFEIF